mgnify:FL=1
MTTEVYRRCEAIGCPNETDRLHQIGPDKDHTIDLWLCTKCASGKYWWQDQCADWSSIEHDAT